jgi:RNA polymerase sigma-70 factor, ECF subfamily
MLDYGGVMAAVLDTDTEHIARGLRQRDMAVFERLVRQYQFRLVRYLIYLLGRRDGVDDLVQETWLRVLERGRSYDARLRFEPWLFAIARNLSIDFLRRQRSVSVDAPHGAEGEHKPLPLVSESPSPFELAARTEDAERLAVRLAALEPMYREALVLRFQEEMSLEEMAAVTGAPVSTVSSRIYRGLAALRAQLEGVEHAR